MRVGLDLDEVLGDTLISFLEFYRQQYRCAYSLSDFSCYRWQQVLGVSDESMAAILESFARSLYFEHIRPVAGAVEGVRELRESCELYVVTSRWGEAAARAADWLSRHFPGCFVDVVFSKNHFLPDRSFGNREKLELCRDLGISVLVDDAAEYLTAAPAYGVIPVLFDRPWNANVGTAARAENWSQVAQLVLAARTKRAVPVS